MFAAWRIEGSLQAVVSHEQFYIPRDFVIHLGRPIAQREVASLLVAAEMLASKNRGAVGS